jgi:benzoyl-CoA reductase/2-hydroxyglutaryl-CoA dehydratase subunit BcrC/BadD/HgdB
VADACCGGNLSCSHVQLVDVVVAEATCDGKKKMHEILSEYVPIYVLDLPQKTRSSEALDYFLSELRKFGEFMEGLTGNVLSDEALKREIRSSNETRKLVHRLFDLRRRDPPPIQGSEVLSVMQKQFFLSPDQFRQGLSRLCDEIEHVTPGFLPGRRIMISGCPMASGNTKVPI